jgi:N-acetylglucosamine-6-sulfatase
MISRSLRPFSLLLVLLVGGLFSSLRADTKKPDVLFVLLDDLRWDALGYMGHPYVKTPNLDRLREQGAVMANAFVTTSICCPSRATFLTGTLANRHGVIDNESADYNPEVTPPLTKYLQEAGYRTAMIGKWHMGNSGAPRPYFDFWLSFKGQGVYNDPLFNIDGKKVQQKGYTTDLLTDYAIDFIKRQPTNQPFFVMLSHKAVHEPFMPAPRHKDAFGADAKLAQPPSYSEDFADKPAWQRRQAARETRWHYRTRELEEEKLPAAIPADPWKGYDKYVDQLRCLAAVDEGIGKIIALLRERGTLDNTLIVFTSDNGYFHMEHRRWDKRLAYEESLRIPMLVVYPGHIQPGSTINQLVTNADFAPTILAYAGLPVPAQMQGASMKPLFEEKNPRWRNAVFYEYWKELVHSIPTMTALRTDRYKLITYPEINDLDELYDLAQDPHEMRNLARDPAQAGLHAAMKAQLEEAKIVADWRPNAFPKNFPRIRGQEGVQFDLVAQKGALVDRATAGVTFQAANLPVQDDSVRFDGKATVRVPFHEAIDPAGWPFRLDLTVNPQTDGVLAVQSTGDYGYKVFVQDGRPGVAVHCKTWIDTTTVVDGPASILGKWTELRVLIDYNRVMLVVDGKVAESVSLPLPFSGSPKTPLVIGGPGDHPVVAGVPDRPFAGQLKRFTIQRGF